MGRSRKLKSQYDDQTPIWISDLDMNKKRKYEFDMDCVEPSDADKYKENARNYQSPRLDSQSPTNKFTSLSSPISNQPRQDREFFIDKKKVAPRSGLQFKVGPSFDSTTLFRPIYINSTNENVFPFVNARIDRGFDFINGEWIGYKRNYFTLVAAFEFENKESEIFSREGFSTIDDAGERVNISCFAIRLVSKCCEDDMQINLVQHTAKRDRGPQFKPPVFPAVAGRLPSHQMIKQAANIRNENKIDQFNKLFYLDNTVMENVASDSILNTYPDGQISIVARYERIQFSTSINYRKPTMVNRHFTLQVELLGLLNDGDYTVLASTETPPLIVRGRSPSNYQLAKMNARVLLEKHKIDPSFNYDDNNAPDYGMSDKSTVDDDASEGALDDEDTTHGQRMAVMGNIGLPIEKRANKFHFSNEAFESYSNENSQKVPQKRGRKKGSKSKPNFKNGSCEISKGLHGIDMNSGNRLGVLGSPTNNFSPFNDDSNSSDNELIPMVKSDIDELINFVDHDTGIDMNIAPTLKSFSLSSNFESSKYMEPEVMVKRSKKSKKFKSKSDKYNQFKTSARPKNSLILDPREQGDGEESFIEFQNSLNQLQTELEANYSNDEGDVISEYIM